MFSDKKMSLVLGCSAINPKTLAHSIVIKIAKTVYHEKDHGKISRKIKN
jgi:hypothetical protein